MLTHTYKRAFTLIELLIVVAIIAILAAIAVPNFLEAQIRSKVSRAKADMRSIATAVESYNVDNNAYPLDGHAYTLWPPDLRTPAPDAEWLVYMLLTTPVAYITSAPTDPFPRKEGVAVDDQTPLFDYWGQEIFEEAGDRGDVWRAQGVRYLFHTTGPDSERNYVDPGNPASGIRIGLNPGDDSELAASILPETEAQLEWAYDPTNGTKSAGEIARTNKGSVPE